MRTAQPGPPTPPPAGRATFGDLLRRQRLAAGLSQEALAERAGLSVAALSLLENGKRRVPHRHTVRRLACALGLSAAGAAALEAAVVRGRVRAGGVPGTAAGTPGHGAGIAPAGLLPPGPPLLAGPANWPGALTSLVGRAREQAEVRALLGAGRLVTLTGAGGVGKTRLALAVAAAAGGDYPDGVYLVELASLTDPALVAATVARSLGLREEAGRDSLGTLLAYLAGCRLLLVLDNCEHLVGACAGLAGALLGGCVHLGILATSREGLRVAGERLFRVPSLAVPPLDRLPAPADLAGYAAVALFLARARERQAGFALTGQNARAVAQVCARLDGVPLAIELAAARVGSLPVEAIAARLDDRFRLLTTGPRTAVPRQRTLRAALDWSYGLLHAPEQHLLQRLSAFAGGWTLEAAEAVCGGGGIDAVEVPGLLAGLADKSLALLEAAGEQGRYRLLETVRQYGRELLGASDEEAARVRGRHLAWCLALAGDAGPRLARHEQGRWLDRLDAEHDNLRAALAWSLGAGAAAQGLQLAGALWEFWELHGHLSEGRHWLGAFLAAAGAGTAAPEVRAAALNGAGRLAWRQGDCAAAQAAHEEGLALFRALGDRRGIAASLGYLGNVAWRQGEFARARALGEESLALFGGLGDRSGMADALLGLGYVAGWQGDHAAARALLEQSLALHRDLGNRHGAAIALRGLGNVAGRLGDHAHARAHYEESLALARELGNAYAIAEALEGLARLALARGQPRRGALLWGAADAMRRALGSPGPASSQPEAEAALVSLRAALGEDAFARLWAAGQALPRGEAIALALKGHGTAE